MDNLVVNLKRIMNYNNLEAREIQNLLGVSKKTMWSVMNGKSNLTVEKLVKFADKFQVSLGYLLSDGRKLISSEGKNFCPKMMGKNLKFARQKNDISLSDIANKKIATANTMRKYENAETEIRVNTLIKLAELYNTDIDELVYEPSEGYYAKND